MIRRLVTTVHARASLTLDRLLYRPIERQAGRCWGDQ